MTTYAELYQKKTNLNNQFAARRQKLIELYEAELLVIYRQKHPRKDIAKDKYWQVRIMRDNPQIVEKYKELYRRQLALKARYAGLIEKYMWELAEVTPLPTPAETFSNLISSSGGDYWSQGFGANKYARGHVAPYKAFLTNLGYTARINSELLHTVTDTFGHKLDDWRYTLEANLPLWAFDLAIRKHGQDLLNAQKQSYQTDVLNPKVYNPFGS